MKLHEMNSEQLRETLCALTGPMCRIAEDTQTREALDAMTRRGAGRTAAGTWTWLVCEVAPLILQRHPEDAYEVAAVLTGMDKAALMAMNGMLLLARLRACWDEEIGAFFSCAGCTEQEKS